MLSVVLPGGRRDDVFEDSLKPSGSHVMDQINKTMLLDCQRSVVHQVYVPAQHESGWATLVASYQKRARDLAQTAAASESVGVFPFLCVLDLRAVLLFEGRVCVQPRVVLNKVYEVVSGFGDLPQLESSSGLWWGDWRGTLESAVLQQPELNLLV